MNLSTSEYERITGRRVGPQTPTIVAAGLGVDSTAMLIGMAERKQRPDAILFANTGGEKRETMAFRELLERWLNSVGFPPLVEVRYSDGSKWDSLEIECVGKRVLPSLAYGFKSCSLKWKRGPQDKWCNAWEPARTAWDAGRRVDKLIGYDASEERRAHNFGDEKYDLRYPLIDWQWERNDCLAAIKRAGLPIPPKSACFFCPASRKSEILWLRDTHPDLFARAVAIERGATESVRSCKGLGRRFSWESFADADTAQAKMFTEEIEMPCGCFDGDCSDGCEVQP